MVDLEGDMCLAEGEAHPQTEGLPTEGIDLGEHLLAVERNYILRALERSGGRVTRAARLLHMSVRSLRYRIQKLGLREMPDLEEEPAVSAEPTATSDRNW